MQKGTESWRRVGLCAALLFVVSSLFASGCSQGARVKPGEEFSLKIGEQVVLEGSNFAISFQGVLEDSRCPQGAECFWEGRVIARLRIGKEEVDAEIVESRLPQEMVFGEYRMVILRILPPRTSFALPDEKEYRIFLKVEPEG